MAASYSDYMCLFFISLIALYIMVVPHVVSEPFTADLVSSNPGFLRLRNGGAYPTMRFSLYASNSYDGDLYDYIRHHIYPCTSVSTISAFDTLAQFQTGRCDLSFISEEILVRYLSGDCRAFNKIWNETHAKMRIEPNIAAIGCGYYEYLYIITRPKSKKTAHTSLDVLLQSVGVVFGVCGDDYYYFAKLLSIVDIDIMTLDVRLYVQLTDMIVDYKRSHVTTMVIMSHPKNEELVAFTRGNNVEFVSYVTDKLKEQYVKYLVSARIIGEDMNRFYRVGNIFINSAIELLAFRTILVVRAAIPDNQVGYLTRNYITELTRMREYVDKKRYRRELSNFNMRDFVYDELVAMNLAIPLHPVARDIYIIEEKLIKLEVQMQCKSITQ